MDKQYIIDNLKTKEIGKQIVFFEQTDSTNKQAKLMAAKGAEHGIVVVAEAQYEGRGRQGKEWLSPPGTAITMSIILKIKIEAENLLKIPLLTGLAVREELEKLCGQKAWIKWPNDIIMGKRKVCGILVESSIKGKTSEWVVVGIGINVNQTESNFKDLPHASSLLVQTGKTFLREEVISKVLLGLENRLNKFLDSRTLDIKELEDTSILMGKKVSITLGNNNITGTVLGFEDDGNMMIINDTGEIIKISGEATVRGLNSYLD